MPPELEGFIYDYCQECDADGVDRAEIPRLVTFAIKGFCNHYGRRDLLHYRDRPAEIKAVVDRYFQDNG